MEIMELAGRHVKIGKTSITARDEAGKTRGIVKNVWKFRDLQANRQIDYSRKIRASGLWGCRLDGIMDRVIIADGKIWYLNDLGALESYKKLAERASAEDMKEFFAGDTERYETRLALVEKCRENGVAVIDCYVD